MKHHVERDNMSATLAPERPVIGRFHRGGTDTEREAAKRDLPRRGTQRAKILERFQQVGSYGATDFENGTALGMFRHAAGTRREELISDGWNITDSGRRRKTDTGSNAIVWVLS